MIYYYHVFPYYNIIFLCHVLMLLHADIFLLIILLQIFSAGQFNDQQGQEKCIECAEGKYQNLTVGQACETCKVGQTSIQGSARCEKCSAGSAGSSCTFCLPGLFRSGTMSPERCRQCPLGWKQPDSNSAGCLPCNLGTSQSSEGQAECVSCLPHYYANQSQMTACFACETGKTQPLPGSASCIACDAGEYGSSCDKCEKGRYRRGDAQDASKCEECHRGYYQDTKGSAACLPCIP